MPQHLLLTTEETKCVRPVTINIPKPLFTSNRIETREERIEIVPDLYADCRNERMKLPVMCRNAQPTVNGTCTVVLRRPRAPARSRRIVALPETP
ncbi:MAG: hypothetical protein Q7T01_01110 [bacterium]|nr:hypothetical protein [bacterium]